jgi:hypothetical protein
MARTGEQAPDSPVKRMWLKYYQEDQDIQTALQEARYAEINKLYKQAELEAASQTRLARNFSAVSPFADYLYLATELAGTGMESRKYDNRLLDAFYSLYGEYRRKLSETVKNSAVNGTMDLSGRPRFDYKRQLLAERLKAVLPFGAALLIFNVLFFAGSYVAFLRYDVR